MRTSNGRQGWRFELQSISIARGPGQLHPYVSSRAVEIHDLAVKLVAVAYLRFNASEVHRLRYKFAARRVVSTRRHIKASGALLTL